MSPLCLQFYGINKTDNLKNKEQEYVLYQTIKKIIIQQIMR